MSIITTTTQESNTSIYLSNLNTVENAFLKLADILKIFQENQDFFSLKLYHYSNDAINFVSENFSMIKTEKVKHLLIEKIQNLKKILVNDIDRKPLIEAVEYQELIWEKWHLEKLDVNPSFYKTHEFAMQLLTWINKLPSFLKVDANFDQSFDLNNGLTRYQIDVNTPFTPSIKLHFIYLIKAAKMRIKLEMQSFEQQYYLFMSRKLLEEEIVLLKRDIQSLVDEINQYEKIIEDKLEDLNLLNEANIKELKEKKEIAEKKLMETQNKLNQIVQDLERQKIEIQKAYLTSYDLAHRIHCLKNESKDEFCTLL